MVVDRCRFPGSVMVIEVTFPSVVGTKCSEGGYLFKWFSGSFGDGKSESCPL